MNRIRYSMLIMAIFIALTLSALNVAPALADESTPTPEPTSSEEVVVETEATPSGDEAQAQETPQPEPTVDSVAQEESVAVAEVIESLPENTEVIVLDENGEALPLASAEAQAIIYSGDPIWCPAGVAPNPNMGGCSPTFTSFTNDTNPDLGLIDWLYNIATPAGVSKAGTIWVAYNYAPAGGETGNIVIDGTLVQGTMENFALTIQGGWNAVNGSKLLDTTTPYSTFNVPFSIINWNNAVTINNIVVTGATGLGVQALNVVTAGNITVNNVDVVSNTTQLSGAELSNVSGTGNVVVNDSTFNNNTGSVNSGGLSILSNGTVTLKNVTANGNSLYGVNISNTKAVTLNGTNHFSYNGEIGLNIGTQGVITLNNVTAMGNTLNGAWLDNCNYNTGTFLCNFGVASAVTIKGTNNFSDNGWDGLRVYSGGAITISNITANNNGLNASRLAATTEGYDAFGKGVLLHNYGALTAKNIVLSGTNTFNGNESNGLTAISYGMITVNNITANQNGCDILFDTGTSYCAGAYLEAYLGVTQTGYGRFSDNTEDGLIVGSFNKGAVTLNNLFADGNGRDGVIIGALGATPVNVTINGTNVFTNNLFDGLEIDSNGAITLNNLTANYNGGVGVTVDNGYALTAKAVTIKGASVFNGNGQNGLEVFSKGVIITNGITAELNGNYGTELNNCLEDPCLAPSALAITMNGNNFFDSNSSDGLVVISRGAITINNLTSTYNGGYGVYADNLWENAVGALTIKGFAFVSNNDGTGLEVYSNGAITLANITANNNNDSIGDGYGAYIDNYGYLAPANVTITGTNNFNGNSNTGLFISSIGVVTLTNITANENVNGGAFIENDMETLAKAVTLNGNNTFNSNAGTGLEISSLGAIKINNVMANNNSQNGSWFDNNNDPLISQPVTITGYGIFNNNGDFGLYIESNGNVTLANISANNNGNYGTFIRTENNVKPANFANVTITGVNTFNDNGIVGLDVQNDGLIIISNITANNNANGVVLDNSNLANGGLRNVTISGVNMFNGNVGTGLYISASGTVTLTRITANNNNDGLGNGTGVAVYTTNGAINLTCGSMYNNADYGYDLSAGGSKAITIKGVFTFLNPSGDDANPAAVITRTCPLP